MIYLFFVSALALSLLLNTSLIHRVLPQKGPPPPKKKTNRLKRQLSRHIPTPWSLTARSYEFATVVRHYWGGRAYWVFQILYNLSMQASNIASMIISAQVGAVPAVNTPIYIYISACVSVQMGQI